MRPKCLTSILVTNSVEHSNQNIIASDWFGIIFKAAMYSMLVTIGKSILKTAVISQAFVPLSKQLGTQTSSRLLFDHLFSKMVQTLA